MLVLLTVFVSVGSGNAVAAVYDPARDCADEAAVDEYDRVDARFTYEVLGRGPGRGAAEDAARMIRREGYWGEFESRFGEPRFRVGADGSPLPYQLFVTREPLGADILGTVVPYCGLPTATPLSSSPTWTAESSPRRWCTSSSTLSRTAPATR